MKTPLKFSMIFHRFCVRKSSQNTSQKPLKIIKKFDQKINPFFNAFLMDFEVENISKMEPQASHFGAKTITKRLQKFDAKIIDFWGPGGPRPRKDPASKSLRPHK